MDYYKDVVAAIKGEKEVVVKPEESRMGIRVIELAMESVEKGGQRLVWLAEGTPGLTWQSGEYYEKNKPGKVNPQVHDQALARGLWERSEALLGLEGAVR